MLWSPGTAMLMILHSLYPSMFYFSICLYCKVLVGFAILIFPINNSLQMCGVLVRVGGWVEGGLTVSNEQIRRNREIIDSKNIMKWNNSLK